MGKVFTHDDVRQGRVPNLESFKIQQQKVREALLQESSVESALIFGSVARGDHSIRSDFDCAVVYQWESHEVALSLMERLCVEASWMHVPLAFTLCDSGVAQTRAHYFGPGFRAHLKRAGRVGGSIKGDVSKHFAQSWPLKEEVLSYVAHKLHKLQAGRVAYCSQDDGYQTRYLQKMLEAPLHVARKTLLCCVNAELETKADVLRVYRTEMSSEMANELEALLEIDRLYTEELQARLVDHDMYEYEQHLGRLFNEADRFIAFVRSNISVLDFVDSASR